ncbi:unnamed protein product [Dovyalis caffra]|uniref:Uncharacterized protein n=1 Tax=Dovyalis caffra TaxID=77055 RepID=A0AAV1SLY1_9ROSI|nr:unnamed protein product [Dovyalis caffra]
MSVERSFEAWEEVQRHGQDLADRLAQGFSGLIQSHITHPPAFSWPNPPKSKLFDLEFPAHGFSKGDFGVLTDNSGINGFSAILDVGNRIGQAGADFGAALNGMVHQFFRILPLPFKQEESVRLGVRMDGKRSEVGLGLEGELGLVSERLRDFGFVEDNGGVGGGGGGGGVEGLLEEEIGGLNLKGVGYLGKPQGTINITSTYDSRTHNIESSLVARGDLWRVEASHGSSTSGNDNASLFLVQLGPVLIVRDSTFLLPVHLSKQHLLWYGYDRKTGMHSLCPAVWSKHRRWLLMSMLCLNPLACAEIPNLEFSLGEGAGELVEINFKREEVRISEQPCHPSSSCHQAQTSPKADLQFPNGQMTYVSGEGLSTSAFLPLRGGLLQAQGQYPGEMRFSFSRKNKWGTRITPMVQWPDKSFTLGFAQSLAWQRSGLMVRPTVQFSLCPTFGGSNPGLRAELIHSVNDHLNLICGCAATTHPSAFASISLTEWDPGFSVIAYGHNMHTMASCMVESMMVLKTLMIVGKWGTVGVIFSSLSNIQFSLVAPLQIGRSKWNGNVGSSGIVMRLDTPLSNVGQPSFSVQINSGVEF